MSMPETVLIEKIKAYIAGKYLITLADLECGSSWYPDVEARYVTMWMLNEYVFDDLSEAQRRAVIGKLFNKRNRNTVRYGIAKINNEWILFDSRFKMLFNEIKFFVKHKIVNNEITNN